MSTGPFKRRLVESMARKAAERVRTYAELAFKNGRYDDTVRFCQEGVELSLKAMIKLSRKMPGFTHDPGHDLTTIWRKIGLTEEELELCREVSLDLRKSRELSFSGAEDMSSEELFTQKNAETALNKAKDVLKIQERIFMSFFRDSEGR